MVNLTNLKNKKIGILGIGYIGSNILAYLKRFNIKTIETTKKT